MGALVDREPLIRHGHVNGAVTQHRGRGLQLTVWAEHRHQWRPGLLDQRLQMPGCAREVLRANPDLLGHLSQLGQFGDRFADLLHQCLVGLAAEMVLLGEPFHRLFHSRDASIQRLHPAQHRRIIPDLHPPVVTGIRMVSQWKQRQLHGLVSWTCRQASGDPPSQPSRSRDPRPPRKGFGTHPAESGIALARKAFRCRPGGDSPAVPLFVEEYEQHRCLELTEDLLKRIS